MGIQIFINSVEETVAVRQITYKEMWLKVRETADKLFVAMQQATLDKEKMGEELAAAKLEIAKLTADNKRLIGDNLNQLERIVSLWDLYQTAASKVNAKEAEKTATTIKSMHMQDGSIFAVETNVPPVESFCGHCGDCAKPTDSRIAELLASIDQVAIDYGSLAYGLPTHVPAIKERMFDAVRMWLAKGGE